MTASFHTFHTSFNPGRRGRVGARTRVRLRAPLRAHVFFLVWKVWKLEAKDAFGYRASTPGPVANARRRPVQGMSLQKLHGSFRGPFRAGYSSPDSALVTAFLWGVV